MLHHHNKKIIFSSLIILLFMVIIMSTAYGAVHVPPFTVISVILNELGLHIGIPYTPEQAAIIFQVRFPRVITAMLVGAALASAGCVMQGIFRNPMADPGLLGVSSGASLGAVLAISAGVTSYSITLMPMFSTVGSVAAISAVYFFSTGKMKNQVLTMILCGIAVSTFLASITSFVLMRMNEYETREFVFWTVGSLASRRWEHAGLIAVPILITILLMFFLSKDINILALGEEEARSLGIHPTRTRKILLFLASITTAMAVCVSGSISFVGLIVPHIMRLLVSPDHRVLLPASALAGAIFLTGCDLIGRIVTAPEEIGVGIVTSFIGAPYFLFLLYKLKKENIPL